MGYRTSRAAFLCAILAYISVAMAGCASTGYGNGHGSSSYHGNGDSSRCSMCGTVQSVRQESVRDNGNSKVVGTVIGAIVGAALGNQVGKGDGRKAATVGGAVAGGAIGHEVGARNDDERSVWRVDVRLDDNRYATVTQRDNPDVRRGDYVEVRNNHVYRR